MTTHGHFTASASSGSLLVCEGGRQKIEKIGSRGQPFLINVTLIWPPLRDQETDKCFQREYMWTPLQYESLQH